jgi:hypothetical protein
LVAFAIGSLAGLAFLAKYQVGPLALTLVSLLIFSKWNQGASRIRGLLAGGLGFVFPLISISILMLISGQTNATALEISFGFLSDYGTGVSIDSRFSNFVRVVISHTWILGWLLFSLFLASLSSLKGWLARMALLLAALFSVYIGGMGFGHYMLFAYCAAFIMLFVDGDTAIKGWLQSPRQSVLFAFTSVVLVFVSWLPGVMGNVSSGAFSRPLDLNHRSVVANVANLCPPGSQVLVWGWVSEFYVNYEWRPSIPFVSVAQIIWSPGNTEIATDLVSDGIKSSDCVIDATGSPFFGLTSSQSLQNTYYWSDSLLVSSFELNTLGVECESCKLWVRKD